MSTDSADAAAIPHSHLHSGHCSRRITRSFTGAFRPQCQQYLLLSGGCLHNTGCFATEAFRKTDLISGKKRKSLPQEQLLKVTVIVQQGMLQINCTRSWNLAGTQVV
ncbi:hypothetical protein Q8A67_017262 [Cirrhinus molitorella]|uniref:Uncharacterized protein n=1 Tax=Cirrhinus molitorella TaxID=172907 RepID=A0AA88PJ82_9TELE|nr:hypothetical protein Q8A67_017262 [Cirrhinus molitorella]